MAASVIQLPQTATADDILEALDLDGVAIVRGFLPSDLVNRLNTELQPHIDAFRMREVETGYDDFLGGATVRLHGIAAKSDSFPSALLEPRLLAVMDALLKPNCTDYHLSAAELIEIRGGETAQIIHRDDGSWPRAAHAAAPLVVNAMVALTDYSVDNGATVIVPGSHKWDADRLPREDEITHAVMPAGSAALFTGQCLHGGGKNTSGAVRRGLSISFCHGWLVPVENSWLGVPLARVRQLPERAQELLGYSAYDGTSMGGGLINMYEVGSPKVLLDT